MKSSLQLPCIVAVVALLSLSCGEPNHYDSHAGDKPTTVDSSANLPDTIQGRSSVQRDTGIEKSNIGIGDTTLNQSSTPTP